MSSNVFSLYLGSSTIEFTVFSLTIHAIYNTTVGVDSQEATPGIVGSGTYQSSQPPKNLFDNNSATMYASRGNSYNETDTTAGLNTGFYVTVQQCRAVLTGFQFTVGSSQANRDPLTVTIEGSNSADLTKGQSWTFLYDGPTGLAGVTTTRGNGLQQAINNIDSYISYRFLITAKRGPTSNLVIYSDVKLFGYV